MWRLVTVDICSVFRLAAWSRHRWGGGRRPVRTPIVRAPSVRFDLLAIAPVCTSPIRVILAAWRGWCARHQPDSNQTRHFVTHSDGGWHLPLQGATLLPWKRTHLKSRALMTGTTPYLLTACELLIMRRWLTLWHTANDFDDKSRFSASQMPQCRTRWSRKLH